jgi:UDP-N-acetyl-D-mannosaminuronic acid dehydrogenase
MGFNKVAVIGAGIVGVPMAAMLADARLRPGSGAPSRVVLIQRDSATSGWKVAALNAGKNPLGGTEPGLEDMIARAAAAGLLHATTDMTETRDADAILVCVQTDKTGSAPDYAPLFEALDSLGRELLLRPQTFNRHRIHPRPHHHDHPHPDAFRRDGYRGRPGRPARTLS